MKRLVWAAGKPLVLLAAGVFHWLQTKPTVFLELLCLFLRKR